MVGGFGILWRFWNFISLVGRSRTRTTHSSGTDLIRNWMCTLGDGMVLESSSHATPTHAHDFRPSLERCVEESDTSSHGGSGYGNILFDSAMGGRYGILAQVYTKKCHRGTPTGSGVESGAQRSCHDSNKLALVGKSGLYWDGDYGQCLDLVWSTIAVDHKNNHNNNTDYF